MYNSKVKIDLVLDVSNLEILYELISKLIVVDNYISFTVAKCLNVVFP
jgi:hypothetical protein